MAQKPLKEKTTVGVAAATTLATLLDATLVSGGLIVATVGFVYIQPQNNAIMWTDDGVTTPTASVGNLLAAGATLIVDRGQFNNWKCIEVAASATVNVKPYQNV